MYCIINLDLNKKFDKNKKYTNKELLNICDMYFDNACSMFESVPKSYSDNYRLKVIKF